MRKKLIIILLGIFYINAAFTQNSLNAIHKYLNKSTALYTGVLTYYTDTTSKLNFNNIAQVHFIPLSTSSINYIENQARSAVTWLKVGLENKTDSALKLYLNCGNWDYVNIYIRHKNNSTTAAGGGYLYPKDPEGSGPEQNALVLPVMLMPEDSATIYVKLQQRTQDLYFDGVNIYDHETLYTQFAKDEEDSKPRVVFIMLFMGFLLSQIIIILLQWIVIKRWEYVYYCVYLILVFLYFLCKYEADCGIIFLFNRYPVLQAYLDNSLMIMAYLFYFKFGRQFLEMPVLYRQLNKFIIGVEYFLLAYAAFDICFFAITFNQHLQSIFTGFTIGVVFICAALSIIYLLRQKNKLIYYFLLGSLCVGLGNVLGLIDSYLRIQMNIDTGISSSLIFSQCGVVLEILFFSTGLAFKNKSIEQQKIQGQQELIKQYRANAALQERVQNIRNNIAQDLHDDIGSTLSSIAILSELVMRENKESATFDIMRDIKDNSQSLMEKMDDIVWSVNPKNDPFDELLIRVKNFAAKLFEAAQIDYEIIIADNIAGIELPLEYRQHIYLIIKEAVNNLVKYSEATNAFIKINKNENNLEIFINDNGKGFDKNIQVQGNGIRNMKNRAELMNARLCIDINQGTALSLTIKIK